MSGPSPQETVERALAAAKSDDCVVIAEETSTANLRWAGNTLTTNGVAGSRQLTVIAIDRRGTGDGHRPWDGAPNGTMTNGEAGQTVTNVDGLTLTVKYKDGEKKLIVTPDTPITRYQLSNKSELRPGAGVSINAVKKPDGTFEAARLTVVRDGAAPD